MNFDFCKMSKEIPETTPWEAKDWTREEWMRWHRMWHPDTSSDHATLNPSWWASKGMKFGGGGGLRS